MQPVGSHQDLPLVLPHRRPRSAVHEARHHPVSILLEAVEVVAGEEPIWSQDPADGLEKHHLETTAVHRVLRPGIPGGQPPGLRPDHDAVVGAEPEL